MKLIRICRDLFTFFAVDLKCHEEGEAAGTTVLGASLPLCQPVGSYSNQCGVPGLQQDNTGFLEGSELETFTGCGESRIGDYEDVQSRPQKWHIKHP